jgi:hypothetical protein
MRNLNGMIVHPNKFHKINPALLQSIIGSSKPPIFVPAPTDWYTFAEQTGNTTADLGTPGGIPLSAYGSDGGWTTLNGKPAYQLGTGTVFFFDNILPPMLTSTVPMSVCMWVNAPDVTTTQTLMAINVNGGCEIAIGGGSTYLFFNGGYPNALIGTTPITAGIHHLAYTYDGSRTGAGITIYIDGVSVPVTVSLDDLTNPISGTLFCIGARPDGSQPTSATISDFRMFSIVLAAEQVQKIYQNQV